MVAAVRVLTWNVWGRQGQWRARQRAIDATVARLRPDIVAVQETWQDAAGRFPQVERLAGLLGYHAAAAHPTGGPEDQGLGVLSRWPVAARVSVPLPDGGEPPEYRLGLAVDIRTPAGRLRVCTTHLNWRLDHGHVRQAQLRALLAAVVEPGVPLVLCGDLNAPPDADEVRMLTGRTAPPLPGVVFQDAWEAGGDGGPGWTWSRTNPEAAKEGYGNSRLDYVLVRWAGASAVLGAEVVEGERPEGVWPSDHFGVLATVRVSAAAGEGAAGQGPVRVG